jgi:hypothetical protein
MVDMVHVRMWSNAEMSVRLVNVGARIHVSSDLIYTPLIKREIRHPRQMRD